MQNDDIEDLWQGELFALRLRKWRTLIACMLCRASFPALLREAYGTAVLLHAFLMPVSPRLSKCIIHLGAPA